jgi:FKBP-type peptidyl-prolyl cis-trans isomerase
LIIEKIALGLLNYSFPENQFNSGDSIGEGEAAELGDIATIHFVNWMENNGVKGKQIYNTREHNKTVSFIIGTERVMPGWNEGVLGMKQNGKRQLVLPPSLGYGAKVVQGVIPPNARLIFVIELIRLEKR